MALVFALGFFLVVLFSAPQLPVQAATYHATRSGSDSANCTTATPCQSVKRMVEFPSLAKGDVLELVCGETYREDGTITAGASGEPGNPITLTAVGTCFKQTGTHEGSRNDVNLVDAGVNFARVGVAAGQRLFNLTDGSHCHVTSITTTNTTNDTLVCAMGLAYGKENDWDAGDRYRIDNYPIVTHAALFDSGWTNEGSNVWSHTTTMHPARHVWINGWSPNSSHHTGTCSVAGMASASDIQWCTTNTRVFIKSSSNPATRWTAPGVEVVHQFGNQSTLFALGNRSWWTIQNIAFERVYGTLITGGAATNITIDGGRAGWSQRANCSTDCWNGNSYSWLAGQDNRGGQLIGVGSYSAFGPVTIQNFLGHDCDNNCITFPGTGAGTGLTLTDVEIFNNFHSQINTGLSSSSAGSRAVTMTRMNLHGSCTVWHTNGVNLPHTVTFQDSLVYDVFGKNDPRQFGPKTGCGRPDPFGILIQDPGTYTHLNNIIIDGGHGLRLSNGTHIVTRNVIVGNAQSGINANGYNTSVRINDSIIADNGSGDVSSRSFQVGCSFPPCTSATLYSGVSNNNKLRQPAGSAIGHLNGVDTSVTLAKWQTRYAGDTSSVTTDTCFVSARTFDYNLANDCDDIAANRGPFREIALSERTISSATLTATWSVGGTLPLSACDKAGVVVEYDNVSQDITTCTPAAPLGHATTLAIATSARPGETIKLRGTYGLVEDSQNIGGFLNARSRAFRDTTITHEGGSDSIPTN